MTKPCIMVTEEGFKATGGHEGTKYIEIPKNKYDNVTDHLKSLKEMDGGDIWVAGDHHLIWACLENNIVVEIVLTILPVALEDGAKLFRDPFNDHKWHAWNKKQYINGVVQVASRTKSKERCS